MWTYVIRTGNLYHDNAFIGNGYSGHGVALNDPAYCNEIGVGPLPVGHYTIGIPHIPIDHLGPLAMLLLPDASNNMHDRTGFFMHGDNKKLNHSASNGCLIFNHSIRSKVNGSADRKLECIAEEVREL